MVLPLAVIEGPVVSAVTGFLSAQGYIAWGWALVLLVCGDVVGDLIYYWIGHSGGAMLSGFGRRLGWRGTVTPDLQQNMAQNATKMLLVGKWTHSIGCFVLVASGMLRLPLAQFIVVNLLATLPKSAVLFGVGYFAGGHVQLFEDHFVLATIILSVTGTASIALILQRSRGMGAER
jgi:membrane protein DedA with SNARE-associated domain